MPRLLIDGTELTPSPKGVGRYSYHVIDQLTRRLGPDWSITIMVHRHDTPRFDGKNVPKLVSIPRLPELIRALLFYPWVVLKTRADVLIIPMEVAAVTLGRSTITVLHDIGDLIRAAGDETGVWKRLISQFKERCRISTLLRSRIVVCNSEFVAREAVARFHIQGGRIRIGYCGVDKRFYKLCGLSAASLYPVIEDWEGYVLTFATGDPREKFHLCPEVWSRARSKLPNIGMVVAGLRPEQAYSGRLIEEFNSRGLIEGRDVVFVPFLSEVDFPKLAALYRDADYYLELSGHEGFGMQLAEAMASGTTCISTGNGALSEVGNGFTVPIAQLEPACIADTIVSSYRRNLEGRDNQSQIEFTRRFSWDRVGALLESELNQVSPKSE